MLFLSLESYWLLFNDPAAFSFGEALPTGPGKVCCDPGLVSGE